MGIMLLLTLMMCVQIVQNPGAANVNHDVKALNEVHAASKNLQASLANLQGAVAANDKLFSAGGLVDAGILRQQKQKARNANKRAERDLKQLEQQADSARTINQKLNTLVGASTAKRQTDQLKVAIADAQKVLQQLEAGKRVLYNRPAGSNECWLVEVSTESEIHAGIIGKKEKPTSFPSIEHCRDWMLSLRFKADFLIIIKPDTWGLKAPLEKVCQDSNITYAFDLLPQNRFAVDPEFGAGF